MSSGVQGAASAAPAVPRLDAVRTPEDALALLRQTQDPNVAESVRALGEQRGAAWRAVTLRAERRYGELLLREPERRGGDQSKVADSHFATAEKDARKKARKVAKVPGPVFEEYVTTEEKPSRDGLLRVADRAKTREALLDDPTLSTRDLKDILGVGETLAGKVRRDMEDSGEIPPEHRRARPKTEDPEPEPTKRGRPKNWDGKSNAKREREIREKKKVHAGGDYMKLVNVQLSISQLCAALETVDLDDYDVDESTLTLVIDMYDDLASLAIWHARALSRAQAWLKDSDVLRKIDGLKSKTVDRGATPAEADAARQLIRRLERRLEPIVVE